MPAFHDLASGAPRERHIRLEPSAGRCALRVFHAQRIQLTAIGGVGLPWCDADSTRDTVSVEREPVEEEPVRPRTYTGRLVTRQRENRRSESF